MFNMMNYIWAGIIAVSFIVSIFTGNLHGLSSGILDSASSAVSISLKLLGTLALWNGLTEILTESGAAKKIERLLSPLLRLIFPTYSKTPAAAPICANITANLLGLGNAATPLGIEAMRRMKEFSGASTADNEMVRFVVINSAALTLIPTTQAMLRSEAGSTAPFSVTAPIWLTGITALICSLLLERILSKRWKL